MSVKSEISCQPLRGVVEIPGDKSITHRAVMFGALAVGESRVSTTVLGRDNFATIRIMRQLGATIGGSVASDLVEIAQDEGLGELTDSRSAVSTITVTGRGLNGLTAPAAALNCGNSGTTARLMTGILAGCPFSATLVGDHSLSKRPFKRVIEPLSAMGASFSGEKMPITITGGAIRGIEYNSPHASAQVKSAIILAGLRSTERTSVREPRLSRDHTERMLSAMGCELVSRHYEDGSWEITLPETSRRQELTAQDFSVPGDFSAAAFFLVAGSIFPESEVEILNVGINPTRIGLFHILERMGAAIEFKNQRLVCGEEVVDCVVRGRQLKGTDVTAEDVVLGIDEVPILAVAAAVSTGVTRVRGAKELRVKESDRIAMTAGILKTFGVVVTEYEDGFDVVGRPEIIGAGQSTLTENLAAAPWRGSGDHRIEMCGAILELLVTGDFEIADKTAVETSFPSFISCLNRIRPTP